MDRLVFKANGVRDLEIYGKIVSWKKDEDSVSFSTEEGFHFCLVGLTGDQKFQWHDIKGEYVVRDLGPKTK